MKITTTRGAEIEVDFLKIGQYGERFLSLSVPAAGLKEKKAQVCSNAKVPYLKFFHQGKDGKCEIAKEDADALMSLSDLAFMQYEQKKKEEKDYKYAPLEEKLPEAPKDGIFENAQREAIRAEIAEIEKKASRFTSEEDEGIYMGIRRGIGKLQNFCPHEWEQRIERTLTNDARLQVKRWSRCSVCGKEIMEEVQEGLKNSAYWR